MRPPEFGKILILQLRRVGDVLMTTPAAAALRRACPRARIDFLAEPPCGEVLEGNPDLDRVVRYDRERPLSMLRALRREGYDLAVDFLGNPRSAVLARASGAAVRMGPARLARRWAYNLPFPRPERTEYSALEKVRSLAPLGIAPRGPVRPRVFLDDSRRRTAREALERLGPGPWIALSPSSRRVTRRWPAASFGRLARALHDAGRGRSLVVWGPGEKDLAASIVRAAGPAAAAAPETPHLLDLAALFEQCRAVVSNCNGPRHLAVAVGTPTLALHFASDPAAWNPANDPRYPYVRAEELSCIGCGKNACPYRLECMTLLSPERVRDAFGSLPLEEGSWRT